MREFLRMVRVGVRSMSTREKVIWIALWLIALFLLFISSWPFWLKV
jgi:hypothetical protein